MTDDGLRIDEDGAFLESFYDPTYWRKWEPEKRTKLGEILANRLNTRRLVDRLIELSKLFDYMVYPNRDHGLREG